MAKGVTDNERDTLLKEIEAQQAKVVNLSGKNDCLPAARWNASKVSLSYGQGWIRAIDGAASTLSLGKTFIVSAIYGVSDDSAIYVAARRTMRELDESTVATMPKYKSSNLIGVRFTKGDSGTAAGDLRLLAEVSNAKSIKSSSTNSAFIYALGADKKVSDGLWLSLRVGRNKTSDGSAEQTTSLLNLNWSSSSTLFGK